MSSLNKPSFAIVGAASLLGKELREVFEALPSTVDLRLLGTADADASGLASDGEEAVVLSPLNEASLSESTVVFLAGDERSSQLAWDSVALRKQRPFLVDMSGTLDRVPHAQLRAPLVESPGFEVLPNAVQVLAHPIGVTLAILLRKLGPDHAPSGLLVHSFLPVSEQGSDGIDELHQQTVNLLGFQNLPRSVFGGQLAFNLMAARGPEASAGSMRKIERKVQTELPRVLGDFPAPRLSVRCIQAPVFHCLSLSIRLEFPSPVAPELLAEAINGGLVDLWSEDQGTPDQLSAVGETGVVVGDLRPDGPDGSAYWLWLVADNLRLRAASAIATARIWLS